jgi:hypothetical protein
MHDLDLALQEMEGDDEDADEFDLEAADDEFGEAEDDEEGVNGVEELELAAELLEASSDEELEHVMHKVARRAHRRRGRRFRFGPLGGILKSIAKKALPMLGTAAGSFVGGPLGARLGASLGQQAGKMFGLELEGMSPEDQEFEVARRVVRLAGDAARQLGPMGTDSVEAAKSAVLAAAQKHAPGLVAAARGVASVGVRPEGTGGRWIRRGRRIILLGV